MKKLPRKYLERAAKINEKLWDLIQDMEEKGYDASDNYHVNCMFEALNDANRHLNNAENQALYS